MTQRFYKTSADISSLGVCPNTVGCVNRKNKGEGHDVTFTFRACHFADHKPIACMDTIDRRIRVGDIVSEVAHWRSGHQIDRQHVHNTGKTASGHCAPVV